jgi:hypothetical protein
VDYSISVERNRNKKGNREERRGKLGKTERNSRKIEMKETVTT